MGEVHSFRDLRVWQEAMNLTEMVYMATRHFPKEEMYGLTSQMRRSAVSVPSNIAEGNGRKNRGEYRQFLGIANGSLLELQTQIEIAQRVELLDIAEAKTLLNQCETVGRLLTALRKSLSPTT